MELVINQCPRGYLLSPAGCVEYAERKGVMPAELDRADPVLVEMLKQDAERRVWAGGCSHVKVVTVPDGTKWAIRNVRGREWVSARA